MPATTFTRTKKLIAILKNSRHAKISKVVPTTIKLIWPNSALFGTTKLLPETLFPISFTLTHYFPNGFFQVD